MYTIHVLPFDMAYFYCKKGTGNKKIKIIIKNKKIKIIKMKRISYRVLNKIISCVFIDMTLTETYLY